LKLSKALLASIFISASLLVMIGGLVSNVLAKKAPDPTANNVATVQAYQQREVAYNQLVQQANQQLEKANQDLQSMQNQITQLKQGPAEQSPATAISASNAEEIALKTVEGGLQPLKAPELVLFEGKTAYEVTFEKGSVFIDAGDGSVLFNGTVPQQITADKAKQIAADYLKNNDVLQVDQIKFHNAPLYRVIFGNGTMVYMDMTGQITVIEPATKPPSVVIADNNSGGGNQSNQPAPVSPQPQPKEHNDHESDD
jgi:uncharacterized membrane protein YkoI